LRFWGLSQKNLSRLIVSASFPAVSAT